MISISENLNPFCNKLVIYMWARTPLHTYILLYSLYRFWRLIWNRICMCQYMALERTNGSVCEYALNLVMCIMNLISCVYFECEMLENSYLVEIWSNTSVHYHVDACTQILPFQMCLERWNQYFKSHYKCERVSVHVSTLCRPLPLIHPHEKKTNERERGKECV